MFAVPPPRSQSPDVSLVSPDAQSSIGDAHATCPVPPAHLGPNAPILEGSRPPRLGHNPLGQGLSTHARIDEWDANSLDSLTGLP